MGNRVQNIADPERLSQLAEAKAQSELELDNLNIKSTENADIREMERISDKFAGSMSEISSRLEMLNSMPDETREKFADFLPPIEEIAAKVAVLAKADPWYMINENSSDTILKNLPWKKIIGFDLSYDYQEGIEQILRGYANGTIEQSRALDLVVEQLKRNHDNKTQVDAHNAGYAKYGVGEYEELGRYLLKMYVPSSDVEYFKANQVREKAQKQVDDIINVSSLNGAVFTGDISINLSNDYNPMSIAELAERLLGDNPSLSIMSNALSRSIDYANFSTGLARNPVNAVNDNSINISNVDVTLTQPIKSANDIINGFVDKINSTYATTKNQR